jgi:hypothetical protein
MRDNERKLEIIEGGNNNGHYGKSNQEKLTA